MIEHSIAPAPVPETENAETRSEDESGGSREFPAMSSPAENDTPNPLELILTRAEFERLLRDPDQLWSAVQSLGESFQMSEANSRLKDRVIEQKDQIISQYREENDVLREHVSTLQRTVAGLQETTELQKEFVEEATKAVVSIETEKDEIARQLEDLLKKNRLKTNLQRSALSNENLTPAAKTTGIVVNDLLSELSEESPSPDGWYMISDEELARRTGTTRQTAGTHINVLADLGVVEIDKRPSDRLVRSGRRKKPGQLVKWYRAPGATWDAGLRALAAAKAPLLAGLEQLAPDQALELSPAERFPLSADEAALQLAPGGADLLQTLCMEHDGKIALYKVAWCLDGGHWLEYLEPIRKPSRPRRKQSALRWPSVSKNPTHKQMSDRRSELRRASEAQNPRQGAPVALSKQ